MPFFEFPELLLTQIVLLVVSAIWLLKRNDEIPLIISSFLFYCGSYRYWAVTSGVSRGWVRLINFGFTPITEDAAIGALTHIIFGEICLLGFYMLCQKQRLSILPETIGDRSLIYWLRPKVITLGLFFLPLVILVRAQVLAQLIAGRSIAFQVSSYLFLFPLALVGIATLILCLWQFNGFPSLLSKIPALLILVGLIQLTFGSTGRFQFVGWIIAAGVILSSTYRPKTRLVILTMLAIVGISMFAVAGAMRNPNLSAGTLNQAAWERAFSAEDANMLDGFVLMQEIYPQRLDFSLGMEHVEILMRPIPRALWSGKPVGGYMNKLGLINANTGFTLGISPTLFGSFYAEGGLIGIVVCSLIYAAILARIVRYSAALQPFASILVRAILCASLVPLLRGGDLPGIYAWIGMAFWTCFLFLWLKRKQLQLPSSPAFYPYPQHNFLR